MVNSQGDLILQPCINFEHWSRLSFGICSWLRGYMIWPKVKEHYENFKPFVGKHGIIMRPMTYNFFATFKRQRDHQFWISRILYELENVFDSKPTWLDLSIEIAVERLVSPKVLQGIRLCTSHKPSKVEVPSEIQKIAKIFLDEENYRELGPLSDWCEDFNLIKAAEHFRQPDLVHTYGCPYLHQLAGT